MLNQVIFQISVCCNRDFWDLQKLEFKKIYILSRKVIFHTNISFTDLKL